MCRATSAYGTDGDSDCRATSAYGTPAEYRDGGCGHDINYNGDVLEISVKSDGDDSEHARKDDAILAFSADESSKTQGTITKSDA